MTYPGSGPPLVSSNTWCGFNSFLKLYSRSRPFRPPLFGFTNTRSGQQFRGILEAWKKTKKKGLVNAMKRQENYYCISEILPDAPLMPTKEIQIL